MTARLIALAALVASAGSAQTIYGAAFNGDTPSRLYSISPTTGAATLIGPIGFGVVSAIALSPGGTLYGVGQDLNGFELFTINTTTGAGTVVGLTGVNSPFQDMAFRSDGVLFGYSGGSIYTVNVSTGHATLVGNTTKFPDGNGLAFSSSNVLYTANQIELDIVNQTTAAVTTVTPLNYGSAFGPGESRANGMKFSPLNGTLYASVVNGGPGSAWSLATINISTGVVTRIGPTVPGIDALAVSGTTGPPLPTPVPASWLLTAAGLAGVALYQLRYRRRE